MCPNWMPAVFVLLDPGRCHNFGWAFILTLLIHAIQIPNAMKTDEIREKYLEFFQGKGHRLCESDVLVPKWDKSVLFTPAGMNPFKDHFLGKVKLEFTRATSSQKCLRTGDIDNVGRTAYHHTFFEMLGNFSFGDYFKREAINWAWEFLTDKNWLGLDPDRLTVTVYLDDDEAAGIWQSDLGLPTSRIQRMDENDNFWPAGAPTSGPDGVCGPCSEIFYHPPDGSKEVEIWNLVFTQFNREGDPPDNLKPLPSKNIDTGMGLERIASTMQGVTTNYHIDTILPIVLSAAEICGQKYIPESDNGRRFRRMADHVRACTFAIHENVYPGSAKEEYVIRRLLRRAVLDGYQIEQHEPFLFQLVPKVAEMMARPYPELKGTVQRVADVIRREESSFLSSIGDGLSRIEKIFSAMESTGSKSVDGQDAAELYQTHGVPPEMFEQIAREREYQFDWPGYRAAMEVHSQASGKFADSVMGNFGPIDEIKSEFKFTEFVGYESTTEKAVVKAIVSGDKRVKHVSSGENKPLIVVLDRTPFYAESGGQVGDTGEISASGGTLEVTDTQKDGDIWLHICSGIRGQISVGNAVTATVDSDRRDAIRRAHTATHVLHHSLQQRLGSHAQQRGSRVADDVLRFDFSNPGPVDADSLEVIESESNKRIGTSVPVKSEILPLAEARTRGAMMLFGEKYPDPVRMISVGDFSRELCGGTHVENSTDIGLLEVVSEEGISAGTRRIEAYTGSRASQFREDMQRVYDEALKLTGAATGKLPVAVERLARSVKEIRRQVELGKSPLVDAAPAIKAGGNSKPDYLAMRKEMRDVIRGLNVPLDQVLDRIGGLIAEKERLLEKASKISSGDLPDADSLIAGGIKTNGSLVITCELPECNPNLMRQLVDQVRQKTKPVAIFLASASAADKVLLVAGISRDLVERGLSAGDWVRETAPIVGGGGGGKPDLAQAGGKQPENIQACLHRASEYITGRLQT